MDDYRSVKEYAAKQAHCEPLRYSDPAVYKLMLLRCLEYLIPAGNA